MRLIDADELINHQIACMLADLFGDACACNYNGIDEWLGELCDFKDTCCPNPVGVACWEQFLKHSQSRYTECGYEVRDKGALQEHVLDKIKAEIEEEYGNCYICEWYEDYDYEENNISEFQRVGNVSDILAIIDKYKTEREDKV